MNNTCKMKGCKNPTMGKQLLCEHHKRQLKEDGKKVLALASSATVLVVRALLKSKKK